MKSKIILVTGASSGLGKMTAIKLRKQGHIVYAVARRVDSMKELEELGINIGYMDVTDDESIKKIVDDIVSRDGKIDVLINNAGYGSYGAVEDVSIEEAQRQFEVNVFGVARVSKIVLPHMREKRAGLVINISSVVGKVALPFMGWYSASKHAIEGLSDAMRIELEPFGVKVVIVEPGVVKTGFDGIVADDFANIDSDYEEMGKKFKQSFIKMYASPKAPTGEVVAEQILKIVRSKNPKIRYRPTTDSKINLSARKILCDKVFDKLIKSQTK